ncbi:hypothetical protein LIX60_30760 [Streptomyces sp. S07_1.15]|uniref:hypothetical protein n=1 Tax=Streptomyces sp. S07_1.15 TaxID=2873925 RepID=UPI001D159BEC|nr:hypothetical protein [Streptomyces sp. S07_1.15]MCC3655764.1 hypothetical protein [Streptomyces sp. S07_1.15]
MSVLPHATPEEFTKELRSALAAAGVTFDGSTKPGSAITHTVTHQGLTWELRYTLQMGGESVWKLTGPCPDYEWGPAASTAEAVAVITAPVRDPEPVDQFPDAPRTHLGVDVPEVIRARWRSEMAEGWRLGVRCAVGELPDTRPRS